MMVVAHDAGYKNINDLAKHLGYKSPEKLYRLERSEKAKPSADILVDFANKFKGANMNWVLTGVGNQYHPDFTPSKDGLDFKDAEENMREASIRIPYYNLDLSTSDITDLTTMEEKPDYFVNYRPFNDCSAYLPVYGDSMYPKYASGDIIAVKEVKNLDVIQWGEAYVVITNEKANHLKSIKILHEHSSPNKIILKSSNPNYKGDTVINKKDILSLYVIKGKITRNMI